MGPQRDRRTVHLYTYTAIFLVINQVVLSDETFYVMPHEPQVLCPVRLCFEWNSYISQNASFLSNSTFVFLPGIHVHSMNAGDGILTISNLNNITFIGSKVTVDIAQGSEFNIAAHDGVDGVSQSIIVCLNDSSFAFHKMTNFSIVNMTFINCGSLSNSAIYLNDVVKLRVEGVSIKNSSSDGLSCHGIEGESKISRSSFIGNNQFADLKHVGTNAAAVYIARSALEMIDNIFISNHATGISFSASNITMGGDQVFINNCNGAINLIRSELSASLLNLNVAGNTAETGGGLRATESTVNIDFGMLLFRNNSAKYGGAFYLDRTSILVSNSSATFLSNNAQTGGAVYALLSNISFFSSEFVCNSNQADNIGGCFYLLSSQGSFGDVNNGLLSNNIAINLGGAMYIDIRSTLTVIAPVFLNFANNSASLLGGAIFVASDVINDLLPPDPCFLTFSDDSMDGSHSQPNISLNFTFNKAVSGTVLYGGNIDYCVLSTSPIFSNVTFNHLLKFTENNDTIEISSHPIYICSCPFNHNTCDRMETINKTLFPGQPILVQFFASGQRIGPSPTIVVPKVVVKGQATRSLPPLLVDSKCQNYSIPYFSNVSEVMVMTQPAYHSLSSNISSFRIKITFRDCPVGFQLNTTNSDANASAVCVCNSLLTDMVAYCNITDVTITKSASSLWIGAMSENSTASCYSKYCLPDICNDKVLYSPQSPDDQCIHGRTGIMCSCCPKNQSLTLGIPECRTCSNYFLLLVLVFAIAGVLLVGVLFLINLTITTGTINGILWYAFVINQNYYYFFPKNFHYKTDILFVFTAWLNLDIGVVTCFYDGLDTFQYTLLQLAFPSYVFVIFGLIVFCNMRSTRISKLCRSNAVPVLATLAYISLSKLIRMSIAALYPVQIYTKNEQRWVWLYDGNLEYFQGQHTAVAIIGLFLLLIVIIPYGALLLFAPWLQSYSHRWGLGWVNRLKPFLDNYQAPYKDQFRCWTGAMFLLRIVTTIISHVYSNRSTIIFVVIIVGHVSVMLIAGITVYRNWRLGVLESFFHINLVATASLLLWNKGSNNILIHICVTWICVGSALVCFLGIVTYHTIAYLILPHCCSGQTTGHIQNDESTTCSVHLRESLLEHSF